MTETWIHIGLHKTGTSSTQRYLREFDGDLLKRSIYYPESKGKAHHNIALETSGSGRFNSEDITLDGAVRSIENNKCEKNILSSESFSAHTEESVAKIVNKMPGRVMCIAYIRPPDEFIESLYTQGAKTARHDKYWEEYASSIDLSKYDPLRRIDPWASVLGDENVLVRPFSRSLLHEGDAVSDFCKSVGIPKLGDALRMNDSIGAKSAAFCVGVLKNAELLWPEMSTKEKDRLVAPLLRKASQLAIRDDVKFVGFTPADRQNIRDYFRESEIEIQERFSRDPWEWPSPSDDHPTAMTFDQLSHSDLSELLMAMTSRAVFERQKVREVRQKAYKKLSH